MNKSKAVFAVLFAIAACSCVPASKYRELQNASRQNMIDRDDFKTENLTLSMQNREIGSKIAALEAEIASSRQDIALAEIERNKAMEEMNTLSDRFNALQIAQDDLIKGNLTETRKLLADLQAAQDNLRQKEDIMRQLEYSMDLKKVSLDELTLELDKKNERMAELEKILDSQKKIVQDLKQKVSEALLGFENNGLTVTNRDGKVYVSLDEKLLFKSASWDIDANGRNALRKLAGVLEKNPGIQVTIEGHTDNVPYNPGSGNLIDNWDLSVKRATTVVRTLLEGTKIDPARLTASGRSEYIPVEAANTPEARQKNRRTEIVLTPDLTELYNLINQY
ncbi:MAG: OmpA family protein [Bacteroidales bacterium]|nr:OmpA family protein [Bacteroidales bacterium]